MKKHLLALVAIMLFSTYAWAQSLSPVGIWTNEEGKARKAVHVPIPSSYLCACALATRNIWPSTSSTCTLSPAAISSSAIASHASAPRMGF